MRLYFALVPPPQSVLHTPHAPHTPTSQSTGQSFVPQLLCSLKPGHTSPPYAAFTFTTRLRDCTAPPQLAVHAAQADQSDTSQSTGQGAVLQLRVSFRLGQLVPLCAAGVSMSRNLVCIPVPHTAVQVPHASHSVTAQCTGQGLVLQRSTSRNTSGHGSPRCMGCTVTRRSCRCVPWGPHDELHSVQGDHSLTSQSMGHGCTLHGRVLLSGGHSRPPWLLAMLMSRYMYCTPPPQDMLHGFQSDHSETKQSTGHGLGLQEPSLVRVGHAVPL